MDWSIFLKNAGQIFVERLGSLIVHCQISSAGNPQPNQLSDIQIDLLVMRRHSKVR